MSEAVKPAAGQVLDAKDVAKAAPKEPTPHDPALVEAVAFEIFARHYDANEIGLVRMAWEASRRREQEEFRGYARAALRAVDEYERGGKGERP